MRFSEIVTFRRDLLFNGAVQLDWLETNPELAKKAARAFAFHGPAYHGVVRAPGRETVLPIVDTASFTQQVVEHLTRADSDDPIRLAIAGYGTGKSHLALTLASMLTEPKGDLAETIVGNVAACDELIGTNIRHMLDKLAQPALVVCLNGMRDFDLKVESIRQILRQLQERGLDTSPLDSLRPRFQKAARFTRSFFDAIRADFREQFGDRSMADIIADLDRQDEETLQRVAAITERQMGDRLTATGEESLQDFVRVACDTYCGPNKPFAGLIILFDEFGRYMELAVQRPHIAGPEVLQQLYESAQANPAHLSLVCFVQYELPAYIARMVPEYRDDLQRFARRYDLSPKARLSTNLETVIANLFEKRDKVGLESQTKALRSTVVSLQSAMAQWFPEMRSHALWKDTDRLATVVVEGCWPLHPAATWLLCRLASGGQTLQQRSALAIVADAWTALGETELPTGSTICATDLLSEGLVTELAAAESFGQQGTSAQSYQAVVNRFGHQLSADELRVLSAILLLGKLHARTATRESAAAAVAMFSGCAEDEARAAIHSLEADKGALSWNDTLQQYEIVSDAIPRAQFLAFLESKVRGKPAAERADVFREHMAAWFPDLSAFNTDFGDQHNIRTREWSYKVSFANAGLLPNQIDMAIGDWLSALQVDDAKGQLIYCYVGPESDAAAITQATERYLRSALSRLEAPGKGEAPIAITFLNDAAGTLGTKLAEYWILRQGLDEREKQRYANFILDRTSQAEREIRTLFESLQRECHIVPGTRRAISRGPLVAMLTALFEAVYPKAIPFPFDGYSTTSGNAAADCALFTRQLFLGLFDREWIAAQAPRQKNRAVEVLQRAWGVLSDAGTLRILPAQSTLCSVVEFLEAQLQDERQQNSVNLGTVLRLLCAPPYGCNLASAGLALAVFAGGHGETTQLRRNGTRVAREPWLNDALTRNVFTLSVLDETDIVKVSEDAQSEWERLLNAWEVEQTHEGKVSIGRKADELHRRNPVPERLFYLYQSLCDRTQAAYGRLREFGDKLDSALAKVEQGRAADDLSILSWGAAKLSELRSSLGDPPTQWTKEQVEKVERNLAVATVEVLKRFDDWLPRQRPLSVAQASEFERNMQRVEGNLATLGLTEQKRRLEMQTTEALDNLTFMEKLRKLRTQVSDFVRANTITEDTTRRSVDGVEARITEYETQLAEAAARGLPDSVTNLASMTAELSKLSRACARHRDDLRRRALAVFNAEPATLQEVRELETRIRSLRVLLEGYQDDVSDLDLVLRQLDRAQVDYRNLDSSNAADAEFDELVVGCLRQMADAFPGDVPPLDSELLYAGLLAEIRGHRQQKAEDWIRDNVPPSRTIEQANAETTLAMKNRLQGMPAFLSPTQKKVVRTALTACDKRLDALEVDGLVAKYEALSPEAQKTFLSRIGVR
ncbi:MAG TPA: hypothetical protein PKW05_07600 [Anaerolineae bacterium]|nr:hypothetical protein [Anaerolineae bacterium]HQJ51627.1 hypothetical protein [Anaerolineae bacterium]